MWSIPSFYCRFLWLVIKIPADAGWCAEEGQQRNAFSKQFLGLLHFLLLHWEITFPKLKFISQRDTKQHVTYFFVLHNSHEFKLDESSPILLLLYLLPNSSSLDPAIR